MGPRADLDVSGEKENFLLAPTRIQTPDRPAPQLSRYTDYAPPDLEPCLLIIYSI